MLPHLSVAERIARGKAARAEVPRSRHAEYEPAATGPTRSSCSRLRRRRACPSWFRSATAGCWSRRSPSTAARRRSWPLISPATPRSGMTVQCCGDAHLSNFGVFASPERRLVFDINDFDETLPGPWEWDVKRLAVSMLIAARDNGYPRQGPGPDRARHGHRSTARRCATSPAMANLAVWYARMEIEPLHRREFGRSSRRAWSSGPRRRSPRREPATACPRSRS